MICIKTQHFKFNRVLLLAIGLWPYQQSRLVRFQIILFFGIQLSFVVFQLTTFLTAECTLDVVIKVLSLALPTSTNVIQYNAFWININNVKYLIERLQHICNEIKDENEISIITKYGNDAKHFIIVMLTMIIIPSPFIILIITWPPFLNTILHINESQSNRVTWILTEFFIDQEKQIYLIGIYINVAFVLLITTEIAIGMTFLTYCKHVCGMFRVASYRIEQAMTMKMLQNITFNKRNTIYKQMIYAVDIHCKALKFAEVLLSNFDGMFFLLIIISVISLSFNLFGIVRNASFEKAREFLIHFLVTCFIFLCMFVGSYFGQELTNHNEYIYLTAYNVPWHMAPLHVQKLILFMLQKGRKSFNVNIGGLIIISLESLAALIKISMSYFTFIYSTQQ